MKRQPMVEQEEHPDLANDLVTIAAANDTTKGLIIIRT